MGGVDVLDEGDLVACRGTLAGGDGGEGKEVFPYLFPLLAIPTYHNEAKKKLTLNHLFPYLATTLSWLPIQFLYHFQRVAE